MGKKKQHICHIPGRLTSELTCAGIQERDPSFAPGVTVARDSPAATNSSVTAEHTR
ncbi:hypothetical protein M9458_013258, partial [Cirrhinus mrigala]